MMGSRVRVNRIIPFSSVDGPGNRTAVFLQGCPNRCLYCHNPETRGFCTACGRCLPGCPTGAISRGEDGSIRFDRKACVQCDQCIHVCPVSASPRVEWLDAQAVMEHVSHQIPFIRGVTVSGGECMLEPEFLLELTHLAGEAGLGTMIDSSGTVDFAEHEELVDACEGVMLDIKAFDPEDHRRIVGVSNETVLKNAVYLSEKNRLFEVRFVIAPSLYDTAASTENLGRFLQPLYRNHPFRIKLIAFRPMGVEEQYRSLTVPPREQMEALARGLAEQGYREIIII